MEKFKNYYTDKVNKFMDTPGYDKSKSWGFNKNGGKVKISVFRDEVLEELKRRTEFIDGNPYMSGKPVSVCGTKINIGNEFIRCENQVCVMYHDWLMYKKYCFFKENPIEIKEGDLLFDLDRMFNSNSSVLRVRKITTTNVMFDVLKLEYVKTDSDEDGYVSNNENRKKLAAAENFYVNVYVKPTEEVIGYKRISKKNIHYWKWEGEPLHIGYSQKERFIKELSSFSGF